MIETGLIWIAVLISSFSLSSSSSPDSLAAAIENNSKKSNTYAWSGIEMSVMQNTLTTVMESTNRPLRKIKSFSPNTGVAPNFFVFDSESPALMPMDSMKRSGSVENEIENESSMSKSVVSETFLEDLGLRSRPLSPSLPSSSQKSRKMASCSTSSLVLLRKRRQSGEFHSSSDLGISECGSDNFDSGFNNDKIDDYRFDFIDIDSEDETKELDIILTEPEFHETKEKQKLKLSNISDYLLANIFDYYSDSNLLDIRLIDKKFKIAGDIYLNYLANLTLKPLELSQISFDSKYFLYSTMMPFYKNQPQIREVLSLRLNCKRPLNLMSLTELYDLKTFKELSIFSNEFIKEIILPQLEILSRNNPTTEPSPIFLLGEALLKSKRFQFFRETILPVLNRISSEMFVGIPITDLSSPDFLYLGQGQKVLGATLHAAISYKLNFSVKHLVKLQIDIINCKNHYGVTALLKIIEYLGENRDSIQVDEENIEDWMESANLKFLNGILIQENFPKKSFLAFEMFLGILNQISEFFPNREESISFLGFNQNYTIVVRIPGGNFYQRTTTILHELVQAQQYDLLYTLGFYLGDLIQSQLDINPLHMAAEMNDPALVAILLNFYTKIDINALTASGHTAIGLVVGKRTRSLKVLLKDSRANPNLNSSVSPLIRSIEIGNMEAVKLLLNHPSIDINHQIVINSKKLSPLGAAVARRRWDVLYLLLRTPNNNFNFHRDSTAMHNLRLAEKALIKFEEKYLELILMIRYHLL